MDGRLLIGVDGGGTHTVAVVARQDGTVIDSGRGPGINYNNIGLERARANLSTLLSSIPSVSIHGIFRMCVGLSALDSAADAETVRAFAGGIFDPTILDLQSDAYVALMGLTQGQPGLIIICGTGSILVTVDKNGNQHVLGGWGHLLGDVGSGHALAVEGLRAAIDGWEAVGPKTILLEAALAHFGVAEPRALIQRVYAPDTTPSCIAQFAKEVLRLEATDAVAASIVERQMRHVAKQAARLMESYPEIQVVGLYGGVFAHHPRVFALLEGMLLALKPQACITIPLYPPELGALIHLFHQQGTLTQEVLSRMQESYLLFSQQTGRIAL